MISEERKKNGREIIGVLRQRGKERGQDVEAWTLNVGWGMNEISTHLGIELGVWMPEGSWKSPRGGPFPMSESCVGWGPSSQLLVSAPNIRGVLKEEGGEGTAWKSRSLRSPLQSLAYSGIGRGEGSRRHHKGLCENLKKPESYGLC